MKETAGLVGILVANIAVTQQRPPQFEMEIITSRPIFGGVGWR